LGPRLIEEIRSAFLLRIANHISHSLQTQIYDIFSFSLKNKQCAGSIWNFQVKTYLVPHLNTTEIGLLWRKCISVLGGIIHSTEQDDSSSSYIYEAANLTLGWSTDYRACEFLKNMPFCGLYCLQNVVLYHHHKPVDLTRAVP
jgi:hypothetical protein